MVLYRRNRVAGGTYFFTVNLNNRKSTLLVDHIDDLRESVRFVLREKPFQIDAWVVLPEHIHAIWTLPDDDNNYSIRWGRIKGRFSHQLAKAGLIAHQKDRKGYDVWLPRFWEHTICDEVDFAHHVDYIHYNPVKHGWVRRVQEWPYSTFRRYVDAGIYSLSWAGDGIELNDDYGEYPV